MILCVLKATHVFVCLQIRKLDKNGKKVRKVIHIN